MPNKRRSRRGSMGFSPRKRARRPVPKLDSWPEAGESPKLLGFAGYKAGMTHALLVDYRPTSTTSGQEVQVPVTVIETPPLRVAAVRAYEEEVYGLRTSAELWAERLEPALSRKIKHPPEQDFKRKAEEFKKLQCDEVSVLVHTQPSLISGVPKKKPEVMEIRVGGGTMEKRIDFAISLLGKEIGIKDYVKDGDVVDVIAVTKGKGFQGHVKRWGVKLLSHKNSKHRRMIGTLGPRRPGYIWPTVPQAGQMGFHQRTELNKRVLKVGDKGEEITPAGGFVNYGVVRGQYVLLHGTVPGPAKRLIRLRDPIRPRLVKLKEAPTLTYVSTASKQGV
ncbi:MAG: 50S ribosomal protein L3 [Methanomassiliicoccales archaeon]